MMRSTSPARFFARIAPLALAVALLPVPVVAQDDGSTNTPASAAAAAEPAGGSFVGTWLLDAAASDGLDPLLAALGRSRIKRAMAGRIKTITQVVTEGPGWMEIAIDAGPMHEVARFQWDQPVEVFDLGGTFTMTATRADGVVVGTAAITADGKPATLRMERALDGAATTVILYTLSREGLPPIAVRRVFRRQ